MLGCRERDPFFPISWKLKRETIGRTKLDQTCLAALIIHRVQPLDEEERKIARSLLRVICLACTPAHLAPPSTCRLPFHYPSTVFPSRYGNCFERMEKLADTSVEGKLQFSSEFFWMERFSLSIRNCTVFSNPLVFARFWIHIGVDRGVDELCRGEVFYGFWSGFDYQGLSFFAVRYNECEHLHTRIIGKEENSWNRRFLLPFRFKQAISIEKNRVRTRLRKGGPLSTKRKPVILPQKRSQRIKTNLSSKLFSHRDNKNSRQQSPPLARG